MQNKRNKGFTLIEIMVVVVILGILAAIVVPQIVGRPEEARIIKARQDILSIESALDLYKLDNGFYPTTNQGLKALVQQPDTDPRPTVWKPYLKDLPDDPWGHPYEYKNPGDHQPQFEVDVYSLGSTGKPGGEGVKAVIGNWNIRSGSESKK
jgi:general secretion pathway protein G